MTLCLIKGQKEKQMNLTMTVRGTLEDDPALQEIVTILYRKAAPTTGAEIIAGEAAAPEASAGGPEAEPERTDVPEPPAKAESAAPKAKAPEPKAAAVSFATVTAAARKALNDGRREQVAAIFEAHGAATLKDIPEAEYAAVLQEIEAL